MKHNPAIEGYDRESAAKLHEHVPPGWYVHSVQRNLLQRFWHSRRFREVSRLIEPTGGTILDVGAADGLFTRVILKKSHAQKIIAIDVLPECIAWAAEHWKEHPEIEFQLADAHSLPFKEASFDAAFLLEMLEHVFEPRKVLEEILRVLKPRGYAILLVPSDSFLFRTIWFFWTLTRGSIWKHTHIQSFQKNLLADLAASVGFSVEVNRTFLLGMLRLVKVRKQS